MVPLSFQHSSKMIRRFVNLVAQKPRSNNGAYSLHRLDVAKHLFYPSTAQAEAAANANASDDGAGGDSKPPKQPGIGSLLRRLPRPIVQFQQVPPTPTWRPLDDMFVLLSPGGGGGGAAGDRILHLHASKKGHGEVYDADSGSVISTLPSPTLDGPNRLGVQPITFSIATGRTTTTDHRDGEEKQEYSRRLYVMTDSGGQSFQCLDLSQPQQHPLEWQPLPPPPFAAARDAEASSITSFTAVDLNGGSTICVSTVAKGTYCFDTRTHEWWQAGDWVQPFDGRAQYVPELDAWLGFSRRVDNGDHQLCASSDFAAAMDARRPPTLQHVWDDLVLPRDQEKVKLSRRFGEIEIERWVEWYPYGYFPHGGHHLINLGGGRFCVAKALRLKHKVLCDCSYRSCDFEDETFDTEDLVVLSGVEVIRGGDGGGPMRMVKHKSKRYNLTRDADKIKWIL